MLHSWNNCSNNDFVSSALIWAKLVVV